MPLLPSHSPWPGVRQPFRKYNAVLLGAVGDAGSRFLHLQNGTSMLTWSLQMRLQDLQSPIRRLRHNHLVAAAKSQLFRNVGLCCSLVAAMSTDERQPNMQARHRSNCYALRYVRPGQLNRLCCMHVNQQTELADSKGVGLEFEAFMAVNKLQRKQM